MKKPQTLSLQEQLLKSGLTNEAKAKQVKTEKRKQNKLLRNQGAEAADEVKLGIEEARRKQAERDLELNQLRKQALDQKALDAQIRQFIELNRMEKDGNGEAYRFADGGKIKTVYVSAKNRMALTSGRAGIVKYENGYEIVPSEIAVKIQERHAASVLVLNRDSGENSADSDPYAAYQVPDDLLW